MSGAWLAYGTLFRAPRDLNYLYMLCIVWRNYNLVEHVPQMMLLSSFLTYPDDGNSSI